MALPSTTPPSLTHFRLLSFDIYSTIIDEATGLLTAFSPLLTRLPPSHPFHTPTTLLAAFSSHEQSILVAHPNQRYAQTLVEVYTFLAHECGLAAPADEAATFAAAQGAWPAFPDSVAALRTLGKYYKLAPLTNVDSGVFARTAAGPLGGVRFDAVYTAEEIGSYKPDRRNFHYLLKHVKEEFGVEKGELLHVAESLRADHVPAKELGLWSAWISRGGEEGQRGEVEEFEGKAAYQWRWNTLGEMARDVEEAFGKEGRGL